MCRYLFVKVNFEGDSIAQLSTCKNMMIAEEQHWKCTGTKEREKGREKLYRLFFFLKLLSLCPTSFLGSGRDNLDFLTLSPMFSIFIF